MVIHRYYVELLKAFIRKKKKGHHSFLLTIKDKKEIRHEIEEMVKAVSDKDASLSLNTLNRFFNEKSMVQPSIHTLDQLSQYVGFSSWNDFVKQHPVNDLELQADYFPRTLEYKTMMAKAVGDILSSPAENKVECPNGEGYISIECFTTPNRARFKEPLLEGRWTVGFSVFGRNMMTPHTKTDISAIKRKNGISIEKHLMIAAQKGYQFLEYYDLVADKNGYLKAVIPISQKEIMVLSELIGGWYYQSIIKQVEYRSNDNNQVKLEFQVKPKKGFKWIEKLMPAG